MSYLLVVSFAFIFSGVWRTGKENQIPMFRFENRDNTITAILDPQISPFNPFHLHQPVRGSMFEIPGCQKKTAQKKTYEKSQRLPPYIECYNLSLGDIYGAFNNMKNSIILDRHTKRIALHCIATSTRRPALGEKIRERAMHSAESAYAFNATCLIDNRLHLSTSHSDC